ncbi:MAG: NAD(P)H-quinone dehydrogenase [Actinobacteria bacterium]|nr:NAD(P)H-quinone dehydrogenase [Actinomycetota bacterium]
MHHNVPVTRVVIVGGGPGGYEAALVAAQLGADVTLVSRDGLGGSTVLTDCVPSKTLVAAAEVVSTAGQTARMGLGEAASPAVDLGQVNARIKALAQAQSADIARGLEAAGVAVVVGKAHLTSASELVVERAGESHTLSADAVLIATGARPRISESAKPDGERILTWEQVYDLPELPSRLIVVGSGVTGAEFAGAYRALGSEVVLVSSRDRVLPGEDADAAAVIEEVFERRGITVMPRSRATSAERTADGVVVTLEDGRRVEGSHCLMAIGSVPNTDNLGLAAAGVKTTDAGFIDVDKVSRTSTSGVYAAGDCTGVLMLASVAAMQGRIAMWHALGDSVHALNLHTVSSTVFTDPEIATVGVTQHDVDAGAVDAVVIRLPLATNARAKMQGIDDGFVKVFARTGSHTVLGGVVVAPRASELIFPLTLAVENRLTVDQVASTFTIYPSLTGSIAEAARRLHTSS